jgi:hypothetical protein
MTEVVSFSSSSFCPQHLVQFNTVLGT